MFKLDTSSWLNYFKMLKENEILSGKYYITSIGEVYIISIHEGYINTFSYEYGFITLNLFFLNNTDCLDDLIYTMFNIDCEESMKLWKIMIMISKNIHVCNSKKLIKTNTIVKNREFNTYHKSNLSSTYNNGSFICPICGNTDINKINIELFKKTVNKDEIIFNPSFDGSALSPYRECWDMAFLSKSETGMRVNNISKYIIDNNMYNIKCGDKEKYINNIMLTDFIKLYKMFEILMDHGYIENIEICPKYAPHNNVHALLTSSEAWINSKHNIHELIKIYNDSFKKKRNISTIHKSTDLGVNKCLGCYDAYKYRIYHYDNVDIMWRDEHINVLKNESIPDYDPPQIVKNKCKIIYKSTLNSWGKKYGYLIYKIKGIYMIIQINTWSGNREKININPHDWRGLKSIYKIDEKFIYDSIIKYKLKCHKCNSNTATSYSHTNCPTCQTPIRDVYDNYISTHPINKVTWVNYSGLSII